MPALPSASVAVTAASHMYVIGKTGTGKSTLLKTLMLQDISAGEGLALFDPHGDLAEEVVSLVPPERQADLFTSTFLIARVAWHFNPFAGIPKEKHALAAAGMVEVFKKLWPDEWGPRLEHLLRNVVFTLLEAGDATFADIPRLLMDRVFADVGGAQGLPTRWCGSSGRRSMPGTRRRSAPW